MSNPKDLIDLLQKADHFLRQNLPDKALPLLRNVLSRRADIPEAHYMSGMALLLSGRNKDAASALQRAVRINPEFRLAWFQLGNACNALQDFGAAVDAWAHANRLHKDALTCFYIGKAHLQMEQANEAETALRDAVSLDPNHGVAHDCLGLGLQKQKRYEEALAAHERALDLERNAVERARILTHLGTAWSDSGHPEKALEHHQNAIALQPGYAPAYNNLAASLLKLKRHEAAEAAARRAAELDPKSAEAWVNLASALSEMKRDEPALECFNKAFYLKPDYEFLLSHVLYLRAKLCDWNGLAGNLTRLSQRIEQGHKAATPFPILPLLDNPPLQKKTAEIYVAHVHPQQPGLGPIPRHRPHDRMRIGYYSADFHNHPVSAQMVELLELHDRSRFELFGFSFGPDDQSELRKRVTDAFDTFIDAKNKSDQDVAALSRELEIDIAVDLGGFTGNPRTNIFAHRAAPIQVNYLGYPATMGAEYIDYIVADRTLIPAGRQAHYSEKVVYLPHTYMPNDRKREISSKQFTREELGLPSAGFVFCSFNRSYKITPQVFDIWMRILQRVGGSVLWLSAASPLANGNLCKEASNRGIDPVRLIFAERMPSLAEHFARHRMADLFLDTFPYNAHSTAGDALWAGLPVLTCMGDSFASRVAASLLNAIELPELITATHADYEALAVELADNPEKLSRIRQKLENNRLATALFDTPLYARHIEAAYAAMYERHQDGLPPENIHIGQ